MSRMTRIKVGVINESNNPLPEYKTNESAGVDLRADLRNNDRGKIALKSGESTIVPTGLKIEIPEGYEAQVRPRSGLALNHGITVLNTPGTIDSDYRGEVGVILVNLGNNTFTIHDGDRIAQMVFTPIVQAVFEPKLMLVDTHRGEGGFGSTGVK